MEMSTTKHPNRKMIFFTCLGSILEFYDFSIYAFFASFIGLHFFPNSNSLISTLNAFAVFATGYFVRPLGGFVFGYFGDRYGRKNVFAIAAFMMGTSTLLVACLPTYQQVGVLAPILLLICRLGQGFSVGGEIPGATVFLLEHIPQRNGLPIGSIFMAVTMGNVFSALLGFSLTKILSYQELMSYGWRIPFVVGFFLGIIAYYFRKKLHETPVFLQLEQERTVRRQIKTYSLSKFILRVIIGISFAGITGSAVFVILFFPTTFHDAGLLFKSSMIAFFTLAVGSSLFGWVSDYIEGKRLILLSAILTIACSYFLMKQWRADSLLSMLIFAIGFPFIISIVNGSYGKAIAELFPPAMRYRGMALSYNFAFAIFSGLAPFYVKRTIHTFNVITALYGLTVVASIFCMVGLLLLFLNKNNECERSL